jgi:23S rRNA (guanosine2251-2'-O)-methyltransferase
MKKLSMDELNRVSADEFKVQVKTPIVVILDSVRSMNNVGSIFRTCDAFAIEKLYLCGITAQPPHKEISKTALGATETVCWQYVMDVVELVRELKKSGYAVYVVEQTDVSVMLDKFEVKGNVKIAVILGNEVFGIDERLLPLADAALEIPQYGTKHSLNVSIAAGIVIWDLFCKSKNKSRQ